MRELLEKYESKRPEIVFEWSDPYTSAEGWVVINSLRGGAAGGGTRMRVGLDKREVESLAKTMEVKFTVSGPQIGGAKSGINFDPSDPRKREVLDRWYAAVTPLLKHYYGTGGDLNVDEVHEVIPITEECGVWHPQEGVFNGHFQPTEAQKVKRIGNLRLGVIKVIEDVKYTPAVERKYMIADMITGYGVAVAVKHYYDLKNLTLENQKVLVQGWGNVGAAAAYFLSEMGAKITGIVCRGGGFMEESGLSREKIRQLFLDKSGNQLNASDAMSFEEINEKVWDVAADIFLPCAASRLVTKEQVDRMVKSGVRVVSCGANVPFADSEIFLGPIADDADDRMAIIPDFIANCGMARVFAYLMGDETVDLTDQGIFEDTSTTIRRALVELINKNEGNTGLLKTGLGIALKKLI